MCNYAKKELSDLKKAFLEKVHSQLVAMIVACSIFKVYVVIVVCKFTFGGPGENCTVIMYHLYNLLVGIYL